MADENTETTVDTGQTEDQGGDGLVSLVEATDAELDAVIDAANPGESAPADEPQPAKVGEEAPPAAPKTEDGSEPAPGEQPAADAQPKVPTQEQWNAHFGQQQTILKQRSTEIGALRREAQEQIAQLKRQADEIGETDPREAAALDRSIEAARAEERRLAQAEAEASHALESVAVFAGRVKPEELDTAMMRQELLEDGLSRQQVDRFMSNMFASAHGETLIQLAKRALYAKVIRKVVPEVIALRKEVAELKAKKGNKEQNIVDKMQVALKARSPLNASTSAANKPGRTPNAVPVTWSDKDLDAYVERIEGTHG